MRFATLAFSFVLLAGCASPSGEVTVQVSTAVAPDTVTVFVTETPGTVPAAPGATEGANATAGPPEGGSDVIPTATPATPAAPTPSPPPTQPPPATQPPPPTAQGNLSPAPWGSPPRPSQGALSRLPAVEARSVVVMDEASGAVLWERNAHEPVPPASLTKVVTALVALQHGNLDERITVDVAAADMPRSSVMGLRKGDTFTLRDLLYGLMLPSGNDAALAIGRAISGSDQAFVLEMNRFAAELGLPTANFANPHGLSARGHEISAYDMAVLSRYAMSVDAFVPLSTTRTWTARGSRTITMNNLNALLRTYRGTDGLKVGYTRSAGRTLAASATRDGRRVYVILMNAPSSQADAAKLLDWAFANHTWE